MIITAGPIAYNGVTANPALPGVPGGAEVSGYQLKRLDISSIQNDEYIEKRPQQEGVNAGDAYSGQRVLTIYSGIYGSSAGDFADQVEHWMAAFNAPIAQAADTSDKSHEVRTTSHGFLPFTFYLPTADIVNFPTSAYPDGIPLQFFARPLASPTVNEDQDAQGGRVRVGAAVQVVTKLLTREPFAISQALHTADITIDSTSVTVGGNAPTSLILQVHFSASSTPTAGINNVWVATALGNADQASAGAAAAKILAPLLLSDPSSAPGPTTDELAILKPLNIYIAGGTNTVADSAANALGAYAINGFTREGGTTRYDTSAIIAQTTFSSSSPVAAVVVYSGDSAYAADGVTATMMAANLGGPAMCLTGDVLTSLETAALTALAPARIYVIGGTAAEISAAMFSALIPFASVTTIRLNGADRYATNLLVSQTLFTGTAATILLVAGTAWPDGAVAASIAKKYNGPVLLCDGTLTSTLKAELVRLAPSKIILVGGGLTDTLKAALTPYATTVVRYAGTNRYTTAVSVLQNTASLLAGGGQFIRISNWSAKAPFPNGPYTIAYLSADATDITQDYIYNPFENFVFSVSGGPDGPTFNHFMVTTADEIPPGAGGSNSAGSVRDPSITSVIAYWRDRWVF